jgi:solute carrier family 25 thiamine pyrophosphate transporter 19
MNKIKDDAIAGSLSGFIARCLTAPFDVLKIRLQLQFNERVLNNKTKYISLIQGFSTIVKEEGVLSLWKGNLSASYLWVSYSMIQFASYGSILRLLENDSYKLTLIRNGSSSSLHSLHIFFAGGLSGLFATFFTYPFDIMRTQFSIQGTNKKFTSLITFISHIYVNRRVAGLYAGVSPALIGIFPYMGLNFTIYDKMKYLISKKDNKYITNGISGAVAGGLSKFLVYPLDTIKKRMQAQVLENQVQGLSAAPRYTYIFHCVKSTIIYEGYVGFYKGIVPTTLKSVFATAITFSSNDIISNELKRIENVTK